MQTTQNYFIISSKIQLHVLAAAALLNCGKSQFLNAYEKLGLSLDASCSINKGNTDLKILTCNFVL